MKHGDKGAVVAQAQRSAATMHGERHERAAEGGAPQALDASPRVAAHRVMLAAVHDSPRVAAQRVQLNGAFSEADSAGADSPIQRVIRVGKKKLKSRRDLSQVWRAHKVDELLGLGDVQSDMLRAQLLRLAEGENFTEFDDWDDAHDRLQDPMLLITAGDGVVSIIKTTTDLSIWLESYPSRDEDAPKNFADTTVLQGALGLLAQLKKPIGNKKVWQAVAIATKATKANKKWGELRLVDSYDLLGKKEEKVVPGRYRRKLPDEERQAKTQELQKSLGGYKLVGLHATSMENSGSLVQDGVSQDRFGSGHGIGKGAGFYIIPGPKVTAKLFKSAKGWGSHVVAVYLPAGAEPHWAQEGENVLALENDNTDGALLYYMFGGEEAVIPPSLCARVKIVVDPTDVSRGDAKYKAEAYDEWDFLKSL